MEGVAPRVAVARLAMGASKPRSPRIESHPSRVSDTVWHTAALTKRGAGCQPSKSLLPLYSLLHVVHFGGFLDLCDQVLGACMFDLDLDLDLVEKVRVLDGLPQCWIELSSSIWA